MAQRSMDPRVRKAFDAMWELGISAQTVKPVLKHLLKLYNKDWKLIEADNYHTLVEAIYELEDDKVCFQFFCTGINFYELHVVHMISKCSVSALELSLFHFPNNSADFYLLGTLE